MQTPSLALSINKSSAIQPGQSLTSVLHFGPAPVGSFIAHFSKPIFFNIISYLGS